MQPNILELLEKIKRLEEDNAALRERTAMLERACNHWQFLASEQAKEIRAKSQPIVSPFFDKAHAPR